MKSDAPRIMIIAGEASGDLYGARLIQAYRTLHPETEFFGIGGDLMREEGAELLYHISQTAIMGFVEVAKHYPFLKEMFNHCEQQYRERRPDAVVLIDYPGFNLRFARKVKEAGGRVLYYISPQVWAWGKNRARKMVGLIDHLACVFPFEEKLFNDIGIPTTFVGHPLLEILETVERDSFLAKHGLPADRPILGLFPGSREQEIHRLLPAMLEGAERVREQTGCSIAVGAARLPDSIYEPYLRSVYDVYLLRDATHPLMQHSHAAVVASGTATVETAWYETPMVIVYRASWLNYQIGKRLINVDNIGMVNILAGKRIIPELLQDDVQPAYIAQYALPYFENEKLRSDTIANLRRVKEQMGSAGASRHTADILEGLVNRR
ncbi:MAG: lipid-A-disaccharide synthase [Bacteroidetes bacterium]|nr:lipid-A-disaccharide synthase [Bacteroidota bacterium]